MKTQNFKPILFSTEMVKAILEGWKTQTRRVIKNHGQHGAGYYIDGQDTYTDKFGVIKHSAYFKKNGFERTFIGVTSPISPGDILWVRETFGYDHHQEDLSKVIVYKADNAKTTLRVETDFITPGGEIITKNRSFWHSSIHMPFEAARIFLKVTDVRVERLQDITRGDAMAEGCPFPNMAKGDNPKDWFQSLWQKINGKKHPWESNPWVWAYSFKRIEKPENFK